MDTTNREKILKAVRRALVQKTKEPFSSIDYESNVFPEFSDMLEIDFAEAFNSNGGRFIFAESNLEAADLIKSILEEHKSPKLLCYEEKLISFLALNNIPSVKENALEIDNSLYVSSCDFLIARNGSIVLSSNQFNNMGAHINANIHLVIAKTSQLIKEVKDAFKEVKQLYNGTLPQFIFISGPSTTADIGGVVKTGIQGPSELYLLLIESTFEA